MKLVNLCFLLLLFIYMYISKLENKKISFVGAVGTLLTSGILFPLLLNSSDKLVKKIKDLINYFLYTMFVILLFGRLDVLLTSIDKIMFLKRFSGSKVSFINRFIQYTHFIPNCFIALNDSPTEQNAWRLTGLHSINIFGILIFIVCIISFIIYKKDKITRLSFIWITYSFFILCVLGWGTAENGLTLYILYFSWAFVILIFNFVKYILEKLKLQKFSKQIIITIAISMLIYNLYDISKMIIYLSKFKV